AADQRAAGDPTWGRPGRSTGRGRDRGLPRGLRGSKPPRTRSNFPAMARALEPRAAWTAVELGFAEILDLRTELERRRYGAPPGARRVSLVKHLASPAGPGSIYLCQRALRSKATLRRGAAEVAGGFAAWERDGLPVEEIE